MLAIKAPIHRIKKREINRRIIVTQRGYTAAKKQPAFKTRKVGCTIGGAGGVN